MEYILCFKQSHYFSIQCNICSGLRAKPGNSLYVITSLFPSDTDTDITIFRLFGYISSRVPSVTYGHTDVKIVICHKLGSKLLCARRIMVLKLK